MQKLVIGVGGLCSAIAGALYGYEFFSPPTREERPTPLRFDTIKSKASFSCRSESYDDAIDRDELMMGIKLLRWYLVRSYATGEVLEVSAGTGRNLGYYGNVKLTLADSNRDMLIEAAAKLRDEKNCQVKDVEVVLADSEDIVEESTRTDVTSATVSANASATTPATTPATNPATNPVATSTTRSIPIAPKNDGTAERMLRSLRKFPPESFDTVVDTFGLCSLADPGKALQQMLRVIRPGGRIVLLEHGKGTWRLINDILLAQEQDHFQRWGCHFNRDIDALITGLVEQGGMRSIWRWRTHFGTTVCAVLEKV